MSMGIALLARSPLARMLAVLIGEYLVRKGFIAEGDLSASVEDIVNIIGFIAMVATLLIWQWRAHHPAKAQVDAALSVTPGEEQQLKEATSTLTNLIGQVKRAFVTSK